VSLSEIQLKIRGDVLSGHPDYPTEAEKKNDHGSKDWAQQSLQFLFAVQNRSTRKRFSQRILPMTKVESILMHLLRGSGTRDCRMPICGKIAFQPEIPSG